MKATETIINILEGMGERVYFVRDAVFTSKWLFENCEFPCTLILERAEKTFEREGVGQYREVSQCRLIVLNSTDYEFQTTENDAIVESCNDRMLEEIATLKNSALFDKFEIGKSLAVYDGGAGVLVTGASIELTCSVVVGSCPLTPAEIEITQNGTYNVLGISTARVNVQGETNIESLRVTPTTSEQTITATAEVDGYAPITIEAVTSDIDSNIIPENIKLGVDILGVVGNLPEYGNEIQAVNGDNVLTLKKVNGVWNFDTLENYAVTTLQSNSLSLMCPDNLNVPAVVNVGNSALAISNLKTIKVGAVTTWSGVFGTSNLDDLRLLEVGTGTNINLGISRWTATNVIAEGQSGIDELNANIVSGLADKLRDRTGLSALTINFSLSVFNILTQDTKNAFTDKNWNVAHN